MTSLTVHIGTHKTGSSAIQASLVASSEALAVQQTVYPMAGRVSAGGHLNLAWETAGDRRFDPKRGGTRDLIREVRQTSERHVILSAETWTTRPGDPLHARWVDALEGALGAVRTSIIAYVRPQWEYIESVYTQQVKSGHTTESFQRFVARYGGHPRFSYGKVFAPWLDRFAVLVRPYRSDVVSDFWSLCGLTGPPSMPRVNSRPGAKELEMIRILATRIPPAERARTLRQARSWLAACLRNDPPYRALDDSVAQSIFRRHEPENRSFAAHVWGDPDAPVFSPPGPLVPSTWTLETASPEEQRLLDELLDRFG